MRILRIAFESKKSTVITELLLNKPLGIERLLMDFCLKTMSKAISNNLNADVFPDAFGPIIANVFCVLKSPW